MDSITDPKTVRIDPARPLVICDVDEVLGLFFQGFGRYIKSRGYELRLERFALFQNIYAPGASEHLDLETGRGLFDDFFRFACDEMDLIPGASEGLAALAKGATVVALTNAPDHAREPRTRWMETHRLPYPLFINEGLKGAAVAVLAAHTRAPVAFIDDLLPNLESVATTAPAVHRFQMIGDPALRALAPAAPERHPRFDDWPTLAPAIARTLGFGA
ncbi:MAG TPA: hypothetical protein VKU90_12960 [Caulobacteraceae bacterium]|nr:hypothetical protein [Caulobacteraceae bacterium]